MLPDFHITHIDFDTPESGAWHPADPTNCEVWATVTVGNAEGGANFQLHICTPQSIPQIADKRYCFLIEEFRGVNRLVEDLNRFIEIQIGGKPGDPYVLLSKHWHWEYAA